MNSGEYMLEGIIIKGIGGFYYVKTPEGIIESRAKGGFREKKEKPLVGDRVKIKISDEDNSGYVVEILNRKSELIRPAVANVSQVIIVASIKNPDINSWLVDKFILMAEHEGLDIVICLNKAELDEEATSRYYNIYSKAGYDVIKTSALEYKNIDVLKKYLKNNISVFAGPSGAGKSSLLNSINKNFNLETSDVSKKTKRGKHTTRHAELLDLGENTFVLDTPGFSALNLDFVKDETEIREYFREIKKYGQNCKFISCLHNKEPNCGVKEAIEEGYITKERYDNYLLLLEEYKNIRRY